MITYTVAFLLALGLASLLTPAIRSLAVARGWIDAASSSRKIHTRPVPRLGGVAIVIGFYAPLAGLLVVDSGVGVTFRENPRYVVGLFVGGLLIALIGLLDDLRGLGAVKKFSAQFLVAALMYSLGFSVESISTPWG
ncbi:MAG: undecaprenyl/decaprenyl-phosphate alpha-N-acetylglucosaminyl 1-phosphate transferase, partial [Myxococcales bacterium]